MFCVNRRWQCSWWTFNIHYVVTLDLVSEDKEYGFISSINISPFNIFPHWKYRGVVIFSWPCDSTYSLTKTRHIIPFLNAHNELCQNLTIIALIWSVILPFCLSGYFLFCHTLCSCNRSLVYLLICSSIESICHCSVIVISDLILHDHQCKTYWTWTAD